jgi:hypothetical protein
MAWVGATQVEVGLEPLVLPAGADAEVGGKPTAAASAGAGASADAGEAGRLVG